MSLEDKLAKEAGEALRNMADEFGLTGVSEDGANRYFRRYCIIVVKYWLFDVLFFFLEPFSIIFALKFEFNFEVRGALRVLVILGVICLFSYLRTLKIYAKSQDIAKMFIRLVEKHPELFTIN